MKLENIFLYCVKLRNVPIFYIFGLYNTHILATCIGLSDFAFTKNKLNVNFVVFMSCHKDNISS